MWNRDTSAVHRANSVRTVRNKFPRLVMRLLLCVDADLDNICTSWNTLSDLISRTYLTFLSQNNSRNYVPVKVESNCKWSMITLFLHCVFVFSLCGFSILKTNGFTGFSTLTQSNFAICSLRFLSYYQKNGHHCNTTPLWPSLLSQSFSPELSVL